MAVNTCPMLERCRLFTLLDDIKKENILNRFCKANFDSCARKILKGQGENVPDDLVPDGKKTTN